MRKMKDSGVEWMKEIPEIWDIVYLKKYVSFEKGKNAALYTKDYVGLNQGEYPVYSGQTENGGIMGMIDSYDYDYDSCIFTTTVGAKAMSHKVIAGKFNLSQNCLIMKQYEECNISYINYALTPLFDYEKSLIPSHMQPSLRIEDLKHYKIPMPPLYIQNLIADYLDEKCAKIDTIIEKQQAVIEKLKEYKLSVITEAVTKGLNPDVEMKDSGVKWIGTIPDNWELVKAKYCVYISHGSDPKSEGEIPVYGSGANSFKTCGEFKEGPTVLIGRKGATLHIPNYIEGRYWNVDTAFDVKVKENYNLKFYYYNAICFDYKFYMSQTTLPGMTQESYKNMYITKPSITEQNKIVNFLDKKCSDIDKIIKQKQAIIDKTISYKKSLIYEVVTGKKEV